MVVHPQSVLTYVNSSHAHKSGSQSVSQIGNSQSVSQSHLNQKSMCNAVSRCGGQQRCLAGRQHFANGGDVASWGFKHVSHRGSFRGAVQNKQKQFKSCSSWQRLRLHEHAYCQPVLASWGGGGGGEGLGLPLKAMLCCLIPGVCVCVCVCCARSSSQRYCELAGGEDWGFCECGLGRFEKALPLLAWEGGGLKASPFTMNDHLRQHRVSARGHWAAAAGCYYYLSLILQAAKMW